MTDDNRTDLNLLEFHIKEEYSPTKIKVEEVDVEIIKTETEVSGGSWVYHNVDINELLANENWNLEKPAEQLLNANSGIKNKAFEDCKVWERVNNLSINHQKDNKNGLDLDLEEKVSQQDLVDTVKINNKKEKLKFLHDHNYCLSTSTLKKRVLVFQEKCETVVSLNHAKGKTQKSEQNDYNATEKKHKCKECNAYAAMQKYHLVYHIQFYRTMERLYKCNECSYVAVHKQELLFHICSCHTMQKSYICNECAYVAVRKQQILCHIKSHHTMRKLHGAVQKCDVAHFQSRHRLEKSYKCNECFYAAVQKGHLLSHIKFHHTIEKPYKCNECAYTAVSKRQLLLHVGSRHTNEKPYKCNECSYAAVSKQQVIVHTRFRHTKEKPYKCNKCSYAAVSKQQVQVHIKCHHTIEKRTGYGIMQTTPSSH